MDVEPNETITKIINCLNEIPSTLDAVDKKGDWSYFENNKDEIIKLATLLPDSLNAKIPNLESISPNNWKDFVKVMYELKE